MPPPEFLLYVAAGFAAQLIDGALGMAYGVVASTLLLATGLPPATVSATVHAAECFTTGASAISHRAFGNVSAFLFRRLVLPGVLGAVAGAWLLSRLPGESLRPVVSAYLLAMGLFIIAKAFRQLPSSAVTTHLVPLGFAGAFLDAIGGGGWGPIVATTLIARGNRLREAVGSVCAAEFFVTLAASTTFAITLGINGLGPVIALAIGGLLAAPIGAWVIHRVPQRPATVAVGALVAALSLATLLRHFGRI